MERIPYTSTMRRTGWKSLFGLVAVVLTAALANPGAAAPETEKPLAILTLNGADPYLPAFVALDRAIRDTIVAGAGRPVEFYTETLDMLRFPRSRFEPEIQAILLKKYRNIQPDVVVAVAPVALEFAEQNRDQLWPRAHIVFHSVPDDLLPGRAPGPRTSGIPVRYEIGRTVELALQLRSDTRRLIVVAGVAPYDQFIVASARRQLARFVDRLDIDYLVGASVAEVTAELSTAGPDTAVLYLTMFRDRHGTAYTPRTALQQITDASPVPVFGIAETYLDTGMVAGVVVPYAAQGRKVGELVLQLTADGSARTRPVEPVMASAECLADQRALQRFDIDAARLPDDCDVRFQTLSIWALYGWQISAVLALIIVQFILIAAFIVQRRLRRRAENEAQRRRAEIAHASRLATMGELTASIAHEINQPLGAILSNADAAEMLLDAQDPQLDEVRQIIDDIRRDDLRASEVVQRLRRLLTRKEMEWQRLDINDVITDVIKVVRAEARRRRVRIETDLAPAPPPIQGDRVHLQQVVLNLLLNAMDAMTGLPAASRRVSISTIRRPSGEVEVFVADRGRGILPESMPKLFDSFYTTKENGLGMGLSIARSIIEAHGGRISAETNPYGGAVFRFVLPAMVSPEPTPTEPVPVLEGV